MEGVRPQLPHTTPVSTAAQPVVKAAANKPQKPPPSCIICCNDALKELVRPCRCCPTEYCKACLKHMFNAAVDDPTQMPPRCCTFLQIHTATLTATEASNYRKKLEEWMSKEKTYCPSPTCSVFIPPRLILAASGLADAPTLHALLKDLMAKVKKDPAARFFRGDVKAKLPPEHSLTLPMDIDLARIDRKMDQYASTTQLTRDIIQVMTNAQQYHGPQHPVARTAGKLLAVYVEQLSAVTDQLITAASQVVTAEHLLCPTCKIGICLQCHQVCHDGPCDTSRLDHELAMLAQFGYKQCPLCKQATKKMFGCSHMVCICGCHWCWGCAQPISECDGGCVDDDEFDEEDGDSEDEAGHLPEALATPLVRGEAAALKPQDSGEYAPDVALLPASIPPSAQPQLKLPERITNLDAGGAIRWAESNLDFGEEPEEDSHLPIWYCRHKFFAYSVVADAFNHGNLDAVECNRCFQHVVPERRPQGISRKRRRSRGALTLSQDGKEVDDPAKMAWECRCCRLIVCVGCRDIFKAQLDKE